jgi:hypothetical protein
MTPALFAYRGSFRLQRLPSQESTQVTKGWSRIHVRFFNLQGIPTANCPQTQFDVHQRTLGLARAHGEELVGWSGLGRRRGEVGSDKRRCP